MKKRIFLEAHNISNPYSGFGQFNYWLLKSLVKYNEEYQFTANASKRKYIKQFKGNIRFQKYYGLHRYHNFRIRKKFDLWHSLNQNSKIEPFYKQPYLLTLHDVIFMEKDKPEDISEKKLSLLKEKVDRANSIVFISQHAKKSANYYLDIPTSIPQYVIYNGNPVQAQASVKNIIPPTQLNMPFLFCIGQFLEMKNFHSLVGMLAQLKDFQLVIAGNNNRPYREVVENEIEKYGLQKRVILTGKISETEKHYYLQNCSAFVFPSLYEGFGLPPIEAMAYGKPIFLANSTSLPEIGGSHAFYWDNYDPEEMAKTFENGMMVFENSKAEYTQVLKSRAASFDWDVTAKSYLNVYHNILN